MTLTDRYIDAAMRTVPEKQRGDLAAELRASIDDQIDARHDEGMPRPEAERAVLTELGDPEKLAADYIDRPLALIGPRYFLAWWRLLKLLWAIVPVCVVFAVALGQSLAGAPVGEVVLSALSTGMAVVVYVAFITTLVFFLVERNAGGRDVGFVSAWTLDRLPEPKESGAGLGDLVTSLILLAALAGAVVWDHTIGLVFSLNAGEWMSFLAPGLWPWWATVLFAVLVLEALVAIAVYARGSWSMRLATANLVLNLVLVGGVVWLALTQNLLNPAFFPTLLDTDGESVTTIITTIFGFGVVAVVAWDTYDAFAKARRASRN